MTLDKAIEVLRELTPPPMDSWCEEYTEAIKLGIEALKWRQHDEREVPNWASCPLPGETKT